MGYALNIAVWVFLVSLVMLFAFPAKLWVFLGGLSFIAIFVLILVGGSAAISKRL